MSDESFQERLEESRNTPLYGGLSKYQHVERLGHKEVEGLLDGDVIVQEKIDGANATVARCDGDLVIASRNQTLSTNGEPATGFRGLVEYVLKSRIPEFVRKYSWALRGEWLVQHSLPYSKEAMGRFYVFDVQPDKGYLHPDFYVPLLIEYGIDFVPVAARLTRPTIDELVNLTKMASVFGASHCEGIIIKRYDFVNQYGRTQWGKMIHEDFKVKNTLHFGAGKTDPAEVRFVANRLRNEMIEKTIHKVAADKQEDATVRHMAAVLGRVWYDLFTEELWDFVKKDRVGAFDFNAARKLVEQKTRDLALAYYNGVPLIHGPEVKTFIAGLDTTD